jgi:UDP-2,3-diacylglucosamine pyrophosphatase LpxH
VDIFGLVLFVQRTRLCTVLNRPALIFSDLHLGPTCPQGTDNAAASVIQRHPNADVLLLGDTFDLSLDPSRCDPGESAARHLAANRDLRAAIREHLQRGSSVMLFAGNHDAQLARAGVHARLLEELGLTPDAPLHCGLWCLRRAGVHFEHGHMYDPDNSNAHPLVAPSPKTEPLGIAMMRNVLGPTGSLFFAHAHEMTPWAGLREAFVQMGPRAPGLIARYYYESVRIFLRAKPASFAEELHNGAVRLAEYARAYGLSAEELERALSVRALPRHQNKKEVFFRLYLDRSLATALGWSCGLAGVLTAGPAYLATAGLGLGYLGFSLSRGKNRYSGRLVPRMREAALAVKEHLGASAVVFGHTHVEEHCAGYVNTGSFGFGTRNGRSYLLLDTHGTLYRMSANGQYAPRQLEVFVRHDEAEADSGVAA